MNRSFCIHFIISISFNSNPAPILPPPLLNVVLIKSIVYIQVTLFPLNILPLRRSPSNVQMNESLSPCRALKKILIHLTASWQCWNKLKATMALVVL